MRETPRAGVGSTAVRVTLFEDRAEVLRRAQCSVPAGVSWVEITGVSVVADDASLVAGIMGDEARVIAARVTRRVREEPAGSAEAIAAAEAAVRTAVTAVETAARGADRARSDAARVMSLVEAWETGLGRVPRGGDATTASWQTAADTLDAALVRALDEEAAFRTDAAQASLAQARAELHRSIVRAVNPRYEAVVEVQVDARTAHEAVVEFTYRTPCAVWRPEHLCRLETRDGGTTLEIVTWATAWQHTGETWADVVCRFSTARPAQSASAPRITEDVLTLRRKSEAEKRTVVVETREQSVAVTGLDRGVRAVDEMPGVEDGGEALWFEASRAVTLPADGQAVRVEVSRTRVPCTVDRVSLPERTETVHVRATATLTAAQPLLAGPVRLARGTELVGRGRVGFVARGDVFELGLGVDDGVRVRRHVADRRDTTPVLGTQKLERTVRLFVSNLGGDRRRLTVTERVPVSEVKEVEVVVVSAGGGRVDPLDGRVHWDLDVPPQGTREVTLIWRIEAPARVLLPF